jgi:hypothetical protein
MRRATWILRRAVRRSTSCANKMQPHRTTNIRGLNECDQPEGPRLMAEKVIGEAPEKEPLSDTGFTIWMHTGKHTNSMTTRPTGLTAYNCNIITWSHLTNDHFWKDKTRQMPKQLDPRINPVRLSPLSQEPANGRYFRPKWIHPYALRSVLGWPSLLRLNPKSGLFQLIKSRLYAASFILYPTSCSKKSS